MSLTSPAPAEDTVPLSEAGDLPYSWSGSTDEFSYLLEGWRRQPSSEDLDYLAGFDPERHPAWKPATEDLAPLTSPTFGELFEPFAPGRPPSAGPHPLPAPAVAGRGLGIRPFDQPNVQEAKDATARILAGSAPDEPTTDGLPALLEQVRPGDYIAIQAYLPRNAEIDSRLQAIRRTLRDRFHVATTVGYGPRFLHSTGQLHKGGPNSGLFVQVVGEDPLDLAIPGQPYTFGALKRAQALGDLDSLRALGRRVARVTPDELEELRARTLA